MNWLEKISQSFDYRTFYQEGQEVSFTGYHRKGSHIQPDVLDTKVIIRVEPDRVVVNYDGRELGVTLRHIVTPRPGEQTLEQPKPTTVTPGNQPLKVPNNFNPHGFLT